MQNRLPKQPVITLSAGPVAAYPRVLQAMAGPVHYDFDIYFQAFYEAVSLKLARTLRTEDVPLILQYEPAVGLEASSASLIGANDVVLNLASGVYGKGFGYWAARTAKEVVEIEVPYNESITADQVSEALRKRPDISVVAMVHHDTPSGTINPAQEIGKVVREHGALLLIDAVSSFGGMDIHPNDCFSDIFVTGPSKCLGGPPGLTIIAVSDRAWRHIEANPGTPRASVLSLLDWKEAWRSDRPFPFTPSVSEVNALDAALDQYLDEGPELVWKRHALTAAACRAGIKAMGLSLWAAHEEIASPTTTAVTVPESMNDGDILAAARSKFGVVFSCGRGDTMGELIRIGHMGSVAEPSYAILAVSALGGALRELGRDADVSAGVEACLEVIAAADD